MTDDGKPPALTITYPPWVAALDLEGTTHPAPADRMRLAIRLARENVEWGTGGPFGAAVFERDTGRVISVGMNLVVTQRNSILHAEVVAIMMAEQVLGTYSLRGEGARYELVASADPCAMCLGAALWSGVGRLVCAADREDVLAYGFEEGPVFEESWVYAAQRGLEVERGVLREEACEVLVLYGQRGGEVYNG